VSANRKPKSEVRVEKKSKEKGQKRNGPWGLPVSKISEGEAVLRSLLVVNA